MTIFETLGLIAEKLKTIDGINSAGVDLKDQQPGYGTAALVTLIRAPYNSQRPIDRFECTITLRAPQTVPLAEFFAYFDRDADPATPNARSVFRLFRGPVSSPVVLSNKAAVIVEQVRDVELRAQDPGGVVVRRCVFDVAVSLR